MSRGEVWLANLDPTQGSEIRKTRPCLVISPAEIHDHMRTVIVAPMTTAGRPAPFRIPITFQETAGRVLLDQIRTIDKSRLVRRLGSAPGATLSSALAVLRDMFEE